MLHVTFSKLMSWPPSVPLFHFTHFSFKNKNAQSIYTINYQCTNFKFNTPGITFCDLAGLP